MTTTHQSNTRLNASNLPSTIQCRILRSSKYPALLVFSAQHRLPDRSDESPRSISQVANPLMADTQDNASSSSPSSSSCGVYTSSSVPYTVLFKQGDDVRQDELAVQLVRFMDGALKGAGMDLRLVTYEVLSLGPREVRRTRCRLMDTYLLPSRTSQAVELTIFSRSTILFRA